MRIFLVLVLALTVGGALSYATYSYVNKAPSGNALKLPTTQVVVAATDLQIGEELQADDVRVVDWPASSVPVGAVSKPEDVVGRGVILPVVQYEPILPMKLAGEGAGAGLPPAIPPGLRAVSVQVNEVIGVAGYVLPGTRVDVLSVLNPSQDRKDIMSKVILTDVQVLAAGTKLEQDANGEKPVAVSVVTMLVNPEEAERLTLAASEGKIQLALRNPLDRTVAATPGVRPAGLMGSTPLIRKAAPLRNPVVVAPAPVAAALPAVPEPQTVEIIRGDKRAREVVRDQE
jgi:pilus assembly protein CpaB